MYVHVHLTQHTEEIVPKETRKILKDEQMDYHSQHTFANEWHALCSYSY
jgi:hypothetical protein